MLGLVVALPEEARALRRVVRGARRERVRTAGADGESGSGPWGGERRRPDRCRGVDLVIGSLGALPVMVARAGAGAGAAARAADCLLERDVGALVAVGFAGALSPALRPGHLLLATEILAEGGGCWPAAGEWLAAVGDTAGANGGCLIAESSTIMAAAKPSSPRVGPPVHRGPLVTTGRVIESAAEKRRLGEATGALAVDMESAAVARRATAAGVPMLALRAITDGVEESLPLDFASCFDPEGQFQYHRLIRLLARCPLAVGGLIRLGRHSAAAGQALASFLVSNLPRSAR